MRSWLALVVVLAAAPAAAQADVTVLYAPPAPASPLVAVTVAQPSADASSPTSTSTSTSTPPSTSTSTSTPEPSTSPPEPDPAAATCEPPSPVRFIRTTDGSRETRLLHLTDCHGAPDAEALLELSILARPRTADRPEARDLAAHASDPEYFASEVRRLDPGLLTRLQQIADRFPGHDIELTSGYRPDARETSRHRTGHALDLRVVGAPLDEVHALALGFDESGVGLYPTSEFLHVDVRPRVTRWVDLAGPGEPTNMVEVITARDGHAASAPALRWPDNTAPAEPTVALPADPDPPSGAPTPARRRRAPTATRASTEDEHRAALRDALDALDALEGLDLGVPPN